MSFPDTHGSRRRRARVIAGGMLAVLLILIGRLFYLQIVRGSDYAWQAQENMIRREPIPALRGRIFDARGELFADNRVSLCVSLEAGHPVYADQAHVSAAVAEVAGVLGQDPEKLEAKVRRHRNRFEPILLARDLQPSALAPLVERLDPIPGLSIGRAPIRWYPQGEGAAHLLGYVGEVSETELRDSVNGTRYRRGAAIGRTGLEQQYEALLRGDEGVTYVEVDALGRKTDLFPDHPPRPAIPGRDLHLFLNARLQTVAEGALRRAPLPPRHRGQVCGAAVVLDPRSGDLLASASVPAYDPNLFAHGLSQAQWDSLTHPDHALLNRAIQAAYPPGSIFKIVTTLAGLTGGVLDADTRFDPCTGAYRYGDRSFGCWRAEGHGRLALRGAFEQSCDIYYYQVARALGLRRFLEYAGTLAIDDPTGVDLPQERAGLVPDMGWYRRTLGHNPPEGVALNLSIGQGEIVLTPLQIAAAVGALVTDGLQRRPRLVAYVTRREGGRVWEAGAPEVTRDLGIPADQRRLIRELLHEAVAGERGTGRRAQVPGFAVGGKTGTAQNPHGEDHSLFVGVAPIDDPQIVVLVVVEGGGHGSVVAAPVAQEILAAYLTGGELPLVDAAP